MATLKSIWIGRDRREETAFQVARQSIVRRLTRSVPVHSLELKHLMVEHLYTRPTREEGNRLIDELSIRYDYDGSMSTDHAIGRFFVPQLARSGWALFCDGDILARDDLSEVFEGLDPSMAVYCVKHSHRPVDTVKMDGQVQTKYARKNWSSFMVINCDHQSNLRLKWFVNQVPGRDLHRFSWLADHEIGALDPSWNWLVGHSDPAIDPKVVHFTSGTPDMDGYEDVPYANEWRAELMRLAA